jgi:hypothetical protein
MVLRIGHIARLQNAPHSYILSILLVTEVNVLSAMAKLVQFVRAKVIRETVQRTKVFRKSLPSLPKTIGDVATNAIELWSCTLDAIISRMLLEGYC